MHIWWADFKKKKKNLTDAKLLNGNVCIYTFDILLINLKEEYIV